MSDKIDISKFDKADVLVALHKRARQQGLGFLRSGEYVTRERATELLKTTTYFDYLEGRVMKVSLKGNELDPRLFDRDNGVGAAAEAIASIARTEVKAP